MPGIARVILSRCVYVFVYIYVYRVHPHCLTVMPVPPFGAIKTETFNQSIDQEFLKGPKQ